MHASAEFVHMADQQGSLVLRILDAAGWRTVYTVPDDLLVLRVIGPLFFSAAEGLFTDLQSRLQGKRIVILKWDAVPLLPR